MARVAALPDHQRLTTVLREPALLGGLSLGEFGDVMNAAEHARLLGWFLSRTEEGHIPSQQSDVLRDRMVSVRAQVREYDRALRWEFNRLQRAFLGSGLRWVLLKGAGYLAADLPCGRGRNVADIDILVAQSDVARAEELLHAHGWVGAALDPYDERYYREWMHELPPLIHADRGAVLDLHHGILPRTSRLRPSSARLLERATATSSGLLTLAPSHMVLHAAAHLFHDGEVTGAIRDLVDVDTLLRHYGRDSHFFTDLAAEATALTLTRPAYYAVRYAQRFLGTPIPESFAREHASWGPPAPVRAFVDQLVQRALPGAVGTGSDAAALALYVRAHWLRMPPVMLTRHLLHQALRSR